MCFWAECAYGHGSRVKAGIKIFCGFDLGHVYWCGRFGFHAQQIADGGSRAVVHHIGVSTVVLVVARIHRLLQGVDHIRVVHVVLALWFVFQEATCIQALALAPCIFVEAFQIAFQFGKACAIDAADHAFETHFGHFIAYAHQFKQAGAAV